MKTEKTIFITGCSRGIGLEIAQQCLQENWKVIGTARKTEFPETLISSGLFTGIYADLAKHQDLVSIIKPALDTHLPDVLINNAGIFLDAGFESRDKEWLSIWNKTIQVNLTAPALLSKCFLNLHLSEKTQGNIINIASRASYRGDTQEYSAYAASKAGLVALTKSIARDYSSRGIVSYSIAPGFVETDMARSATEVLGKEMITKNSAFSEITQPREVAALAVFLASGAVRHATGQTFHINGGSYMI